MRRYIELTLSEGKKVLVDISALLRVAQTETGGCIIRLINGEKITPQEPYVEVYEKVAVALRR